MMVFQICLKNAIINTILVVVQYLVASLTSSFQDFTNLVWSLVGLPRYLCLLYMWLLWWPDYIKVSSTISIIYSQWFDWLAMLTENNIPSMGVCTLYQGWWWILTSLLQWQQHTSYTTPKHEERQKYEGILILDRWQIKLKIQSWIGRSLKQMIYRSDWQKFFWINLIWKMLKISI